MQLIVHIGRHQVSCSSLEELLASEIPKQLLDAFTGNLDLTLTRF